MRLCFTCPRHNREFETERYSLESGYSIITDRHGERTLSGKVKLTTPCPYCGAFHAWRVEEIGCPLERTS